LVQKPKLIGQFEILLGGNTVTYTLKESRKARMLWLSIKPGVGLTVTIPSHHSRATVKSFLESKSNWILKHLYKNVNHNTAKREGVKGTVSYLGVSHRVVIIKDNSYGVEIIPANAELVVRIPNNQNGCNVIVEEWLKGQAREIINRKISQTGAWMGVYCNKVTIRNQKARWGSCSRQGNLSFNWRLVMAPESVLDYVVIHELCHLKEMNHSKDFWKLVSQYCPEWKIQRKWLNSNSIDLHAEISLE
jgi:predicted metal-dependent hydrolase